MKKWIVIINIALLSIKVCGQTNTLQAKLNLNDTVQGKQVYLICDDMPVFPGGDIELRKFIATNIKYPNNLDEEIVTKVCVTFVIDTLGNCINESLCDKSLENDLSGIEESVLKVLNEFPKWKPGKHNGELVPVRYTLPVNIDYQNLSDSTEYVSQKDSVLIVLDIKAIEIARIDSICFQLEKQLECVRTRKKKQAIANELRLHIQMKKMIQQLYLLSEIDLNNKYKGDSIQCTLVVPE